ncbi:hypothetical protein C4B38_000408 [Diabrotica virgifera virgifera]|nr:hypothetical protein C4B38_000408 [Diabrotica virgifera virgifera]
MKSVKYLALNYLFL